MQARELRQRYLQFFESKGALRLPSESLVADDPTLLFTVAGMVPFKDYFEDRRTPPRASVTTAQKCLRTVDIDDIGDISHCTFFEMLGNFSFGDYFKTEAVTWAWEFLTGVLTLDPANLRVTVYQEDDAVYDLWTKVCGLPPERVSRLGQRTNYWPSNAIVEKSPGPCGPCSEIFFDLRPDEPFDVDWDGEGSRWLEIWNLVFTQFTGQGEGDAYQLVPLPKKNIDTGMGLERTAAAINRLQGPFETDVLRPIIARLEELSGKTYTSTPEKTRDVAFRRIADHARASAFLLSDGVTPDRTGRGYVLRRLLRRAIVAGIRALGFDDEPFLHHTIPTVVAIMGDQFPELAGRQDYLVSQVRQEETLFRRTLANGLTRLDDELAAGSLSGAKAFDLYDTFGLPFEITREIAVERGIVVDEAGYQAAENEARERSRAAAGKIDVWGEGNAAALSDLLKSLSPTRFVGYTELTTTARVVGVVVGGEPRQAVTTGEQAEIICDATPFYAEAGGQVGDAGTLEHGGGVFAVSDTKKQNGLFFHKGTMTSGHIGVGQSVAAQVNAVRRRDIMRNHTATHLLHKALRDRLGHHVQQRGSLVAPDRLRFDFAHTGPLSHDDLRIVEREVNAAILAEMPVAIEEKPLDEARQMGAMMLFGEKYGDVVRVVSVGGEYSREFCGGTHVANAAQIGLFRLVSEGSAASGVRRVEALTGQSANAHDEANQERLQAVAQLLGVAPAQTPHAVERLQNELKTLRQTLGQAQRAQAGNLAEELAQSAQTINHSVVSVIAAAPEKTTGDTLAGLADDVLNRLQSGVVVLGAAQESGKVLLVAKASKDVVARGVHAGEIVKAAAQAAGGGGGGRPDYATAGGRDAAKIPAALAAARATLEGQLAG